MKKRILSVIVSMMVFSTMMFVPEMAVEASDDEPIMVDGSYLTHNDSSIGTTSSKARGTYLMDGESSISKAGLTRVYSYASTTANFTINYIATLAYVEQYHPEVNDWGQVYYYYDEVENNYYLSIDETVSVDRGYYYRTRANHIVGHNGVYEETASATDGIFLP